MYSADGFLCHISTKGIREMERHMFEKGDMVVCGNNGVCRIEKISKLDSIDIFRSEEQHCVYSG